MSWPFKPIDNSKASNVLGRGVQPPADRRSPYLACASPSDGPVATVPAVQVAELAEARLQQVRDWVSWDAVAGDGRGASARGAARVPLSVVLGEPDGPVRARQRVAWPPHAARRRVVRACAQPERASTRVARPPAHRRAPQGTPLFRVPLHYIPHLWEFSLRV